MTRLPFLAFATAALALPGCIINHDLGQTAGEDSSSGGTLGGTTGDSANEDGSSADPSATSGQIPTVSSSITASGDDSGSSITATSDDGSLPTATTGERECEEDPRYIAWNQDSFDALPGIPANFAAVLSGGCQLADASQDPGEGHLWTMELDCMLSGRIDGDDGIVDQDFVISLGGSSSDPWMSWIEEVDAENLELRVVLDWWGMGWNRYIVLSDPSGVLLDLVAAEYEDPTRGGSLVEDAEAMLDGEAWHGSFNVDRVDTECNFERLFCNGENEALLFESLDGADQVELERNQSTEIATNDPDRVYRAAVVTSFRIPEPGCPDTPTGSYDFALWALEL